MDHKGRGHREAVCCMGGSICLQAEHVSHASPACMCVIMAPIALLTPPGRRDPPLCVPSQDFFLANEGSLFLPSGGPGSGGGVINKRPVKPFDTVPVI